jgi:hypothetical protein
MNKMQLKEIFERDIHRNINPAVVVGNDERKIIQAEIEEYIFTDELIEKLFEILNAIVHQNNKKTGIWINGYYGSGKSHFIKFVHYLINGDTSEAAFDALGKAVACYDEMRPGANERITTSNLNIIRKRVGEGACDDILFNIENFSDDGEDKEKITRLLLNVFYDFMGYNPSDILLAGQLEKPLDKSGKLVAFKKAIKERLGHDWAMDGAQLIRYKAEAILEVAKSIDPSIDISSLLDTFRNRQNTQVSINGTLIPELKEYLRDKDSGYRLVFLIDEISAYVGTNSDLLVNLQTIIEEVSDKCEGKVWIACTAQQTLEEVSSGVDTEAGVQNEFGKILGRFDTRISLQSNDASYITQRRVLDKNSQGIQILDHIYLDNKDYIENQFKLNHELYKGYKDQEEFTLSYPFVPYQFRLIANVFDAFQQLGYVITQVKNNERSILGITHFTAKEFAEKEVGSFIAFDAFYNGQFETNLTHRGLKAVQNALDLQYVKDHPFAKRVVRVLFMISNLLDSQKQTFPSNLDNLTVLLMDQLDQNKRTLQNDIKEVLDRLIEESIIREEKGSYLFFNEDEMEVQNLIKGQALNMDDRWNTFDKEFFRPLTKLTNKTSFGHNDFRIGYQMGDKRIFPNGQFDLIVLLNETDDASEVALRGNKNDLVFCLNEWFITDEQLRKDFDWYCKTERYFVNNSSSATGARVRTNDDFKVRNRQLKDRITERLKHKFPETRLVSQQIVLESNEISGSTPPDRLANAIELHLKSIYKNHLLSADYAQNTSALRASAQDNQVPAPILKPAEEIVNDYISSQGNEATVFDLIRQFQKEPFGWRDEAVIDILIQLVKKKKREFRYKGEARYPIIQFVNKAISSAERSSCEVITGEGIDQVVLDATVKAYKQIFNSPLAHSTDGGELMDTLQADFKNRLDRASQLESTYRRFPFAQVFTEAREQLLKWESERRMLSLFNELMDRETALKELFDRFKGLDEFAATRIKEYCSVEDFFERNRDYLRELDDEDREKVKSIEDFLSSRDPRKDLRHSLKAKAELEKALNVLLESTRERVITLYTQTLDELDAEAQKRELNLDEFVKKDQFIQHLQKLTSLSLLKDEELKLSKFKSRYLNLILQKRSELDGKGKAQESIEYHVHRKASAIENEAQLEDFLQKLRSEMNAILKEKKTIIIK